MRDFFANIRLSFIDYIDKLKLTDKKVIIKTVVAILAAIIIAVSIILIVNERKDPAYNIDKVANNYISEYTSFNYYKAYDHTILGKNGVDNYIEKNYLNELSQGEITSDKAISATNSIALAYSDAFFNKVSLSGYNDCDAIFDWYFSDAISVVQGTADIKDFATKKVLLASLKEVIKIYKIKVDEKLKDEYIGYDLKAELIDTKKFTDEEVDLYKTNKSEKAKKTFDQAQIDPAKIKAVTRYNYNIVINSKPTRTMSVYLIKIGSKWYVDNTALI